MLLTNVLSRLLRRPASLHRRQKTHWKPAPQVRSFMPRLEMLEDRTVLSTWTVTSPGDSGDGSLRAVIAAAQSGDQIVFDPSLHSQTITLTSGELAITKSLDIEGPGADQLTVSGNHSSRIFNISGAVTVTVTGLTLTDGLAFQVGAQGRGGAIENVGGTLTVANDVFSNNLARGVSSGGVGGAIDGRATVTHCLFIHNQAIGDNAAAGGALTGATTVTDSTFVGNQAIGGDNSTTLQGFARGGAIYNSVNTLTVVNSTFTGNQAIAGSGNTGPAGNLGQAIGGGIANTEGGSFLSADAHSRATRPSGAPTTPAPAASATSAQPPAAACSMSEWPR
jgi:hypothetical protein